MRNPAAAIVRIRPAVLNAPPVILFPALIVGAALLLPPVYLAVRSLGSGSELWDLLFRERVAGILGRTLLLVVTVTAGSLVIALPLAWLTARTDLPLRRTWAVLTSLPLVIPSYVAGFVVVVALGPRGMLQGALEGPFGIDRLPSIYGFAGAMLTLTFLSYPYMLLTFRAALQRMDPALEESARGLGLGPVATFFRVVAPLLRPAAGTGALLVGLYTLSDFGAVSLLRYETFTWAIFSQYESSLDRTLGAGLSLALVALALAWVALEYISRGRSRYYSTSSGTTRPPPTVRLGRWRWPSVGLCASITGLALGLPVGILLYWVVRGLMAGEPLDPLWAAARNSLYISALAALAATAAALPVGLLSVRHPGLLSGTLERLGYVSFALPGNRHRPGAGVLRGQLRRIPLPDYRAAAAGLRGVVPVPGPGRSAGHAAANEPSRRGSSPRAGTLALGRVHVGYAAGGPPGHRGRGLAGISAHHEGAASHANPQPHGFHHPGCVGVVVHLGGFLRPRRHAVPAAHHPVGRATGAADAAGTAIVSAIVITKLPLPRERG